MIIAIFAIFKKKTKNLWVKVKNYFFPKSTPRPFFESLGPDIPVDHLGFIRFFSMCWHRTPLEKWVRVQLEDGGPYNLQVGGSIHSVDTTGTLAASL